MLTVVHQDTLLQHTGTCAIGVTRAPVASMQRMSSLPTIYPHSQRARVVVWAYKCDMCDLSRAGAEENQRKQEVLGICVPRDLTFAKADLRLDAQLDCKSEERLCEGQ